MVLHVLTACAIIGFVLMQHGKGADMGAAFGGGSAGSLFGAAGSANFLSRTTGVLAAVFFITSLGLTWLSSHQNAPSSVMQHAAVPAAPATPATPAKSDAVPTQAPPAGTGSAAPASPAQGAAPTKDAGSKAKDVPN
jgi:preprotein translocase subunit SecG